MTMRQANRFSTSMAVDGLSRRMFLMTASAVAALPSVATAQAKGKAAPLQTKAAWLDGKAPALDAGQTWGTPWPQGVYKPKQAFRAVGADGGAVPLQTWPLAYWPDGSLKWTAHALAAGAAGAGVVIEAGAGPAPAKVVAVKQGADNIEVSTGEVVWRFPRTGNVLVSSASRGDKVVLRNLRLVLQTQDQLDAETGPARRTGFDGAVESVTVEQSGPVRAVIRIDGRHRNSARAWAPFTVRFYAYAGADSLRMTHTFIFDGDEAKDFICGLGVAADVPMSGETYDRHMRLSGEGDGLWAEAVRPLTGLRRDPGKAFREAQIAGRAAPDRATMAPAVRDVLSRIPEWGDVTLSQPNAHGFTIRKRTKAGYGWIDSDAGERASGLAYVGGPTGGAAIGLGNFWKAPPTGLEIRDAATDTARLTAWLWSPDAPPMDIRFYHDGLGMKTHPQENEGLGVTYEDYEEGWGTPNGVGRTTELRIWALAATPARDQYAPMARLVDTPPRLMTPPDRLHAAGVFGAWSLPDRTSPLKARIEDRNDQLLTYYKAQIDQRGWYGFWNYGDVMHSYDDDRHQWRYDIGGFAWDNSELSTDLWLWLSYVRGGRADIFRMAEAMTRHTSEVDTYHLGRFKGLGTRHGVQHWADSSKQPRVSNVIYRRIYYYLTADERVGDLMRDLVTSDEGLRTVDIGRKLGEDQAAKPGEIRASFGTVWSTLAGAWFTEWERTGDTKWRDRIAVGMRTIAALQTGWFANGATYDLKTGSFSGKGDVPSISHLNAVFGAPEIHVELLAAIKSPEYEKVWLEYCRLYNAPAAEQTARFGKPLRGANLTQAHSRLTAYAAVKTGDKPLAARAWREFFGRGVIEDLDLSTGTKIIQGPTTLNPVQEAAGVSTNGAAQWGLAAIMNLALVSDALGDLDFKPR
jgi:hypothetical protein